MSSNLLWHPSPAFKEGSNLWGYIQWLKNTQGKSFANYSELWKWSTTQTSEFWLTIWNYFSVIHDGEVYDVVSQDPMPYTKWFDGTKLNYSEHIFRNFEESETAILFQSENQRLASLSWRELKDRTASLQHVFKEHGISEGDTVAAYLPCIPEATIAFLATNSLGAIWSSCSPDFGTQAVIDRFAQIRPKVLVAVDRYQYNGKEFSKDEVIRDLLRSMPSIQLLILVSPERKEFEVKSCISWSDAVGHQISSLTFKRVPFAHPIWVLYSSGTTGLPKAITHSHGGVLLEQLKYCHFHNDFKKSDHCFWYTTTGWMMWNYIHGSLLCGGKMVLYDGSPAYPSLKVLWSFIEDAAISHFGTSAGFILANMKEKTRPLEQFDLKSLRSIGSTGSTLPPEGFQWIYKNVKPDVWLASMSGGTDVCSAFVGGNPLLPVYEGEIQCRALGCSLECYDENGHAVINEEGEMVITKPMPSMPVFFWNDPGFVRYNESYFEMFPSVWRHGDWIKITSNEGIIIYGRSDATLNRGGVRIGTSEVYRAVDKISEVQDSLIVCIERNNGEFWMPLFVILKPGFQLDEDLKKKINGAIRTANSPRHVPDDVIVVPDIPYTISGKKTETPVKKILMGRDPGKIINVGSLKNPSSLDFFVKLSREHN